MAPRHVDILQATVLFVDSIFSTEKRQKEGKLWELNQRCAGYAGNNPNTSIEKYFWGPKIKSTSEKQEYIKWYIGKWAKPTWHLFLLSVTLKPAQTCRGGFCHQGYPWSCCPWTRWSSETCSPLGRCRQPQPTVHTHTHSIVLGSSGLSRMSFKDMIVSVYCNSNKWCWGLNGLTWLIETTWRVLRWGLSYVTCTFIAFRDPGGACFPWVTPASNLRFIPEGHDLPNIMDQTHQLEPVCTETVDND